MRRQPDVNAAAWLVVVGSAAVAAVTLQVAPDRSAAAWVVLPALVWGVAMPWAGGEGSAGRSLALALALRLPFVGAPVLLSDDLWRYLWEGRVLAAGLNPFLVAPLDLPGLDDALRARVNHGDLTSIYPPVALVWFRLLDALGGTATVARVATVCVDLATVWILHRNRGAVAARWWALHPVAVLTAAHGAHIDVVAVTLGVAAVAFGRPGWAVLGAGVKLFPALLLARLPLRPVETVGAAVLVALASGPWWVEGALDSARTYAGHWAFNGAIHPWLSTLVGDRGARLVLLGAGALALAWSWRSQVDAWRAWRGIGLAFVLLTPTAHPWYGLWLLAPAVALGDAALCRATTWLLCGYGALVGLDPATGAWVVPAWVWPVTWIGFLISWRASAAGRAR